jgi:hypothetical protein
MIIRKHIHHKKGQTTAKVILISSVPVNFGTDTLFSDK